MHVQALHRGLRGLWGPDPAAASGTVCGANMNAGLGTPCYLVSSDGNWALSPLGHTEVITTSQPGTAVGASSGSLASMEGNLQGF